MKDGLLNKLFENIFPKEVDSVLEHLEDMDCRFNERIKGYGFMNKKEYENFHQGYVPSINRYPVNCDC